MAKKKTQSTSKMRQKRSLGKPRPIDRIRDSAGSMEINPPDDDSPITGMIVIDNQMHVVKERGVYRVMLADGIDPDRRNRSIPNAVQRVLNMGSDSELIGKTLLTGQSLFKSNYLPKEIDCDRALALTFAIAKDLVSMCAAADSLLEKEEQTIAASEVTRRNDGSVIVPGIGVVEAECKAFLQQAGHVQQNLLDIVKLFYRDQKFKKWFDSFVNLISETTDENDEFLKFLNTVLPLQRFVRDARNCVEHPKDDQFVRVTDFFISPEGRLVAPTIEVVHPTSKLDPTSASYFMKQTKDDLVVTVEGMLGYLCARHVQAAGGFQCSVCVFPEDRRHNRNVGLGYAMVVGDELIPAS